MTEEQRRKRCAEGLNGRQEKREKRENNTLNVYMVDRKMVKKRKYVESLDGRRKKIYKEKIIY